MESALGVPKALQNVHAQVRRHDLIGLLDVISRISWDVEPYGEYRFGDLSEAQRAAAECRAHDFACLARSALVHSDPYRKATVPSNVHTVADLLNLVRRYKEPQAGNVPWADAGRRDWGRFFVRLSFQQFGFQVDQLDGWARARYIWEDLSKELSDRPSMNLDAEWREQTGLFLHEAHCLVRVMLEQGLAGVFSRRQLLEDLGESWAERIDSFLSEFSASPKTLKEIAARRAVGHGAYDYYEFNPLLERPIVSLSGGRYVAPSLTLLLRRFGEGAYYDLFNRYSDPESPGANRFAETYGALFEEYVRRQLQTCLGTDSVIGEFGYGPKKARRRFADCTVVTGPRCALLECKAGRLRLPSKVTAADEALLADLTKTAVRALKQLHRCIADAKEGRAEDPRLASVGTWLPLVVYSDQMVLVNADPFTRLIDTQLADESVTFDPPYQGIDVGDLELLVTTGSPETALDLIETKAGGPPTRVMPFRNFLQPPRVKASAERNPLLRQKVEEMHQVFAPDLQGQGGQ